MLWKQVWRRPALLVSVSGVADLRVPSGLIRQAEVWPREVRFAHPCRARARHPIHKAMGGHASDLAFMKRGYGEETVIWDCVVIGDFESLNFRKVKRPWKVPFFRTSCVCVTVCPLENVLTRISCS